MARKVLSPESSEIPDISKKMQEPIDDLDEIRIKEVRFSTQVKHV